MQNISIKPYRIILEENYISVDRPRDLLHFLNFIHPIKSLSPNLSLNIHNSVPLILHYIHESVNEKISCYVTFPRPQLLPDVCSLLGSVHYLFLLDDIIM